MGERPVNQELNAEGEVLQCRVACRAQRSTVTPCPGCISCSRLSEVPFPKPTCLFYTLGSFSVGAILSP